MLPSQKQTDDRRIATFDGNGTRTSNSRRSGLPNRRLARRVETIREEKRPRLLKGKSITCLILNCPPLITKLSKEQSKAGYPHTDQGSIVYGPRASHVPKNSKLALRVTFGKKSKTNQIDHCASARLFLHSKHPRISYISLSVSFNATWC